MRKSLKSTFASLMLFCSFAGTSHAQEVLRDSKGDYVLFEGIKVRWQVAPELYLSEGRTLLDQGLVIVQTVAHRSEWPDFCQDEAPRGETIAGCRTQILNLCFVYLWGEPPEWYINAVLVLHEAPHCAGWGGGEEDHPGGTFPTAAELQQFL